MVLATLTTPEMAFKILLKLSKLNPPSLVEEPLPVSLAPVPDSLVFSSFEEPAKVSEMLELNVAVLF